eukprot:TRINITY_DN40026_c0_g1_i1.p1 TRINITY_DN40026_c0_g1~~TRINITY_DN40026_c0_g1_i1.p1  ORF type:complete len:673 (+),score=329.34 TRINITY_DN40026_c0_g1_i1:72-2090(+)
MGRVTGAAAAAGSGADEVGEMMRMLLEYRAEREELLTLDESDWVTSEELSVLRLRVAENDAVIARLRRPAHTSDDEPTLLLRREVDALQELCDEQARDARTLRQQVNAGEAESALRPVAVLRQEVSALTQICADAVAQTDALLCRLEEVKGRRMDAAAEMREAVDAELSDRVCLLSELQLEEEEAEGEAAEAEAALREAAAERDAVRAQADSLRADLAALRAAAARTAEELVHTAQATAAAAGAKALAAEETVAAKEAAEGRVRGLEADLSTRQSELDRLGQSAAEKESEIDVAKQLVAEREKAVASLRARAGELQRESAEAQRKARESTDAAAALRAEISRRDSGELLKDLKVARDLAQAALSDALSRGTVTTRRLEFESEQLRRQESEMERAREGSGVDLTELQDAERAASAAAAAAERSRDTAAAAEAAETESVGAEVRDLRRAVQEKKRGMTAFTGDRRDLLCRLRQTIVQRNDELLQLEGTIASVVKQMDTSEAETRELRQKVADEGQDGDERDELLTLQRRLVEEKDRQLRLQARRVSDAERRVQLLEQRKKGAVAEVRAAAKQRALIHERDRELARLSDIALVHQRRADAIEMQIGHGNRRASLLRKGVEDDRRLCQERSDVVLLLGDSRDRARDLAAAQRQSDAALPSYRPLPRDRYSAYPALR